MEKKLSGILLSRDCYLWTNIGLKSIEEIQQDDVILGLDRKANIISYKVKKNPSPFGPQKLVNLITTYGNIALPGESELYTPYGPKKAEKIEIDDHIEMIPFSICEAIRNSIVKDGVDVNEILNNEIAYLLARARIRDKTGRTHFKIRNKNEMEKIGKLLLSAQKLLNGKIILKSNDDLIYDSKLFSDLLVQIDLENDTIPKFLRTSGFEIMHNFFLGLLEKNRVDDSISSFKLPNRLVKVTSFINDMAWITGRKIVKKSFSENGILKTKTLVEINPVHPKERSSYSIVQKKEIIRLAPAFMVDMPLDWEPIVDNMPIHRQKLTYRLPK